MPIFGTPYAVSYDIRSFGAKADGISDDTNAIQAAITQAQLVRGIVQLPNTACKITQTLVISAPITLRGTGVYELFGNLASGGANSQQFPTLAPYLTGSVLKMAGTGLDAIQITTSSTAPNLENFGIVFTNAFGVGGATGHGINCIPPALSSNLDVGICGASWENIKVYGHDGNHYGFVASNPWYCTFKDLRSYGGGILHLVQNSVTANYGNSVFIHPYGVLLCNGTAHNYFLDNQASGKLNLLQFDRIMGIVQNPSPAISGVTGPSASQFNLQYAGDVESVHFTAPNFESQFGATGSVHFPSLFTSFDNAGIINGYTNNVNINPNSGPINQNTSGTNLLYAINATFNPSASVNAFLQISTSPNSNMSGPTVVYQVSIPPGVVFDNFQDTATFLWPAGYYMTLNYGTLTTLTSYGPTVGNLP